jgi:uncharacterized membrane-anchored protein YjiN (DUF445 family)
MRGQRPRGQARRGSGDAAWLAGLYSEQSGGDHRNLEQEREAAQDMEASIRDWLKAIVLLLQTEGPMEKELIEKFLAYCADIPDIPDMTEQDAKGIIGKGEIRISHGISLEERLGGEIDEGEIVRQAVLECANDYLAHFEINEQARMKRRFLWRLFEFIYTQDEKSEGREEIISDLMEEWEINSSFAVEVICLLQTILAIGAHKEWIEQKLRRVFFSVHKDLQRDAQILTNALSRILKYADFMINSELIN